MTVAGKQVSFKWKHRKRPTPYRIKRFGDALFAACGMISLGIGAPVLTASEQNPVQLGIALGSLVVGALGKFLSTLFAEDDVKEEEA